MKPFLYPITEIVIQPDYSERKIMIESNVRKLNLGPVQTKRYFESIARVRQENGAIRALNILKKYHAAGGAE